MKSENFDARAPRFWGMSGVFPGALGVYQGDAWANKLRFVAENGFHGGTIHVEDLEDAGRRATLEELAQRFGQIQSCHGRLDYREPVDAARIRLERQLDLMLSVRSAVPLSFFGLVLAKGLHRFDRTVGLEDQLSRLSAQLSPACARAREAGLPVVIENHGDYYVSDLVELCGRVPGLEIMLDTGNCFLIGERPDLLPDAAFPLVRATHWKDHYARPNPAELTFDLTGATLGEGHVGLQAIYERLLTLHPDPASIFIMIEWVPDPGKSALQCFEDSKRHLEALSRGFFPARKKKVVVS